MAAERAAPRRAPKSHEETIRHLEQLRTLFRAVIDYNEPLLSGPGQQAAAARRIADAAREIEGLDREIADLHD